MRGTFLKGIARRGGHVFNTTRQWEYPLTSSLLAGSLERLNNTGTASDTHATLHIDILVMSRREEMTWREPSGGRRWRDTREKRERRSLKKSEGKPRRD